jgi:ADP-ribose pyrophosphatase YjhB (NUDIX family)
MKLVDTLDEQELLEQILDRSKPAIPASCKGFHYLLATPFRYWPYPNGGRFRRAEQLEGCLYSAMAPETAIAEQAFYRFLFFLEAPATSLPGNSLEHTAFSAQVSVTSALDLTTPPLNQDASLWTHLTDYGPCQDLADKAREAGIQAIRYLSVRDPQQGLNLAILRPDALVSRQPEAAQTWRLFIRQHAVQAFREMPYAAIEFQAQNWAADPRIAAILARLPSAAD